MNEKNAGEISIEKFKLSDLDDIMEIECEAFTAPWTRESYEELWPMESIDIWVARSKGKLVGYMLLQHVGTDMELHTFAVQKDHRRQGFGKKLLQHMIGEAKNYGVTKIFLQVRVTNDEAKSLYEKFGFKGLGLRRAYYKDNNEDALIMRLEL